MLNKRVSFFDLEYAMERGYVHNPYDHYASFSNEPSNCSVYYQSLIEKRYGQTEPCKVKCETCRKVCETNDYIRGKLPHNPRNLPSLIKACDIWPDMVIVTQYKPMVSGFYSKRLG